VTPGGFIVAVVNSVWQGLALVGIVALVLRCARRSNAATTCAIWCATFFVVTLLPAVDVALQHQITVEVAAPVASTSTLAARAAVLAQPIAAPSAQLAALAEATRTFARALSVFAERLGLPILALWAFISSTLLWLLARNGYALLRLKRGAIPLEGPAIRSIAERLSGRRRVRICSSDRIDIPCAAGFLHPMVLLPRSLVETLSDDDLARVVLHEVGHLERFDDWSNALERVLSAIFFFQPALSIAAARIDFERELACDDRVLAAVGEPVPYAECLTRIVERQVRRRRGVAAVPGFFIGRSQVAARIARLVDRQRNPSVGVARPIVAALLCLAFAAAGIANVQVPFVARAVLRPVPPRARPSHSSVAHVPAPRLHRHLGGVVASSPRARVVAVLPPVHARVQRPAPLAEHATTSSAARSTPRHAPRIVRQETVVAYAPEQTTQRGPAAPGSEDQATASDVTPADTPSTAPESPVSAELAEALVRAGYHVSETQLAELESNGVTATLVRTVVASGIRLPPVQSLVGMCQRGIDRALVQTALRHFGNAIGWEDLAALRDEDIGAQYLDALAGVGYNHLSVRDAIALKQNGISAEYVTAFAAQGYEHLSPSELIDLRNEGVDAEFLQQLAQHGYHGLSTAEVVRLHDEGLGS
jgi:beta-lactamase regulating signal transducer with metallopeptidase domain